MNLIMITEFSKILFYLLHLDLFIYFVYQNIQLKLGLGVKLKTITKCGDLFLEYIFIFYIRVRRIQTNILLIFGLKSCLFTFKTVISLFFKFQTRVFFLHVNINLQYPLSKDHVLSLTNHFSLKLTVVEVIILVV